MDQQATSTKKKSRVATMSMTNKFLAVLVVLAVFAAGFFYMKYQDASSETVDAVAARNAEESADVLTSLGSILVLDEENEPTVAKIDDASVLKEANPEFYSGAANGDYLVLYPTRAIIFRLEDKQIINFAPIINTGVTTDTADDTTDTTDEVAE